MIGTISTFVTLGEGEDVAANAQRITDGVGLSLVATQVGWIAALIGVAILVPSIIQLKKKR